MEEKMSVNESANVDDAGRPKDKLDKRTLMVAFAFVAGLVLLVALNMK
jgi:hypothetical protein